MQRSEGWDGEEKVATSHEETINGGFFRSGFWLLVFDFCKYDDQGMIPPGII